jgi:hypothetical protein
MHSRHADTPSYPRPRAKVRRRRLATARLLSVALAAMILLVAVPPQPQAQERSAAGLSITVLSNHPDMLSGDDALVEIGLPRRAAVPPGLAVTVDGRDVTGSFAVRRDGRYLGLVTGLRLGANTLTVSAPGHQDASLELTNHPIGGPIFAGAQVQPWRCATEEHGLGPSLDAQCNTPTVHEFFYRSKKHRGFRSYNPAKPPPRRDIRTTTTDEGHTVPYIVRRERGVIDRGIYDIAVLYRPGARWRPWAPQPAWNGKLLWTFGGSCQPYHAQQPPEGRPDQPVSPGVLDHRALSRGFAVASSAMTVLGSNCNPVVAAEAMMMVKEHLVETYGPVRYTIGLGGSGGSILQLQIAEAYPGLLDGITMFGTLPDLMSTATENFDCRLLLRYFRVTSAEDWSDAAMRAVAGHAPQSSCHGWIDTFSFSAMLGNPTVGCTTPLRGYRETDDGRIVSDEPEPSWVYDPEHNRDGVRCTIFDYMGEVFGRDGEGFARRPYDNAGIQYGLTALLDGDISADQFVDLNTRIGGLDLDYQFEPSRTVADARAVAAAYRSGQVVSGRSLAGVPILDASVEPTKRDVHSPIHSWTLRERLTAANGSAANHVIRQGMSKGRLFRLMDRWLARLEADAEPGTLAARVARAKPPRAAHSGTYAGAKPRMVAGAPLRDDVLKCQLKPLDRRDYAGMPQPFTAEQWLRMVMTFPNGVCDWDRPGVAQTTTVPWAEYGEPQVDRDGLLHSPASR